MVFWGTSEWERLHQEPDKEETHMGREGITKLAVETRVKYSLPAPPAPSKLIIIMRSGAVG